MKQLNDLLLPFIKELEGVVQLIIYNDFEFTKHINDYLWITYTRSNPSHDIYGIEETIEHKHWGCIGPMVIDARKKPHHAPELKILPETEQVIERFFKKGGPLEKWAGH
jgi:4-hydroxy-3-polyprenylbenzoate decarboxylase